MATNRAHAVRIIASSLCFDQDPPPVRSLDKAKIAAGAILDALAAAGMMDVDPPAPGTQNGGPVRAAVADDQEQLPI